MSTATSTTTSTTSTKTSPKLPQKMPTKMAPKMARKGDVSSSLSESFMKLGPVSTPKPLMSETALNSNSDGNGYPKMCSHICPEMGPHEQAIGQKRTLRFGASEDCAHCEQHRREREDKREVEREKKAMLKSMLLSSNMRNGQRNSQNEDTKSENSGADNLNPGCWHKVKDFHPSTGAWSKAPNSERTLDWQGSLSKHLLVGKPLTFSDPNSHFDDNHRKNLVVSWHSNFGDGASYGGSGAANGGSAAANVGGGIAGNTNSNNFGGNANNANSNNFKHFMEPLKPISSPMNSNANGNNTNQSFMGTLRGSTISNKNSADNSASLAAPKSTHLPKSTHITRTSDAITKQQREHYVGYKGATVWMTGFSGSGKSTIAMELEKRILGLREDSIEKSLLGLREESSLRPNAAIPSREDPDPQTVTEKILGATANPEDLDLYSMRPRDVFARERRAKMSKEGSTAAISNDANSMSKEGRTAANSNDANSKLNNSKLSSGSGMPQFNAYRLDGDNLRFGLNRNLGFSPEDRKENVRRVAEVSKLLALAGTISIVSLISPYKEDRDQARKIHEEEGLPFLEVFVDVPLSVAEERDPKGLYQKARSGVIKEFTGISAPYEAPSEAELHLRSDQWTVQECSEMILEKLLEVTQISGEEEV